ncbi:uncharacterized protein LOC109827527 [Asparagus officinalis]|uniref:uncharacterized protein LOC109827527 n=1 Tax=Asparagus officinalis TaxID=4686 RepID=UPI00098E443C|nr:uncharacterized protein LOC109827527 [Asparagus officinalis]
MKKGIQFIWGIECQKAFETLKTKLTTAPVLSILSSERTLVVYTDVSLACLGGVLIQTQRVVAYAFRQLRTHEQNYPHTRLEASSSGLCTEDMEALPVWDAVQVIHRPLESEVPIFSEETQPEVAAISRVHQGL